MARFQIAHLCEQGVDLIIVPLESSFNHKTQSERNTVITGLQIAANRAGLRGTVVPVWRIGGSMYFIAPQNWHPFFRSLSWNDVLYNVNRELTIDE